MGNYGSGYVYTSADLGAGVEVLERMDALLFGRMFEDRRLEARALIEELSQKLEEG